jgi:hypothetical protein
MNWAFIALAQNPTLDVLRLVGEDKKTGPDNFTPHFQPE